MELFAFIVNAAVFIIGFLYPSFCLYEYLAERKRKRLYMALEHFVAMVLMKVLTTFLDILLDSSVIYGLVKLIILSYFVNNKFTGSHTIIQFFGNNLREAFPFLFEFAEDSNERKFNENAHIFFSHLINVFSDQYNEITKMLDEAQTENQIQNPEVNDNEENEKKET